MNKKQSLFIKISFVMFLSIGVCLLSGCKGKNKHIHQWIEATCTTPKTCATCNEISGNPLGHNPSDFIVIEQATCTTEGLLEKKCTRCSTILDSKKEDKLGHNIIHHDGLAPTCTTDGYSEYDTCSRCDYTTINIIDKLDHDIIHHDGLAPTCTTDGYTGYDTCSRCDYETEKKVIPMRHNFTNATNETEKICQDCGTINLPTTTSQPLILPKTFGDEIITWSSNDHSVIFDDGTIVSSDVEKSVTLTATFNFKGVTINKDYEIIVKPVKVDASKYVYAYNYYSDRLKNGLAKDAKLITKAYNGYKVRYESTNEDIITSTGKITQTIFNQETIMNIYIIKDNIALLYPTNVKVLAYTATQRVDLARPEVDKLIEDFQNGNIDTLPVYLDKYEVDLKWSANVPEMIVLGNMVLTPLEKTDVELKCTITYDTYNFTNKYSLIQVGGTISKELYLSKLLQSYANIELKGSINHLHDEYGTGELYLDYQERINSGGVLNLFNNNNLNVNRDQLVDVNRQSNDFKNAFFGSSTFKTNHKPAIPQDVLDKKMYPGYKMPNDKNVLWIVVHESAMTLTGQNAKLLADIQYRYAFLQNDARAASWNYQVDAYSIYQSFEDDIICWHAGDGTSSYATGNNNGIGIEMCVNRDGNYEGTLANNAKLVASLMLKYNLNIDNVKRHYDMSGKECPSYLIRTNRWEEFVEKVRLEYLLQKYFSNAKITHLLTTNEYQSTDEVLSYYFNEGTNGLWYNKNVQKEVEVNFKVVVELDGKNYEANSVIRLLPNGANNG